MSLLVDKFSCLAALLFLILAPFGQTEQSADSAVRAETHQCLLDFFIQADLDDIKPFITHHQVGGGTKANNTYTFNYHYKDSEFQQANIDPSLPVKVFTHGFLSQSLITNSDTSYLDELVNTLAQSPNTIYNLFVFQWPNEYLTERVTILPAYTIAAATTPTLGQYLGHFLIRMHNTIGVDFAKTHLMGHSLGAHVVSFAAKYLKSNSYTDLWRVTGLEPAAPCFEFSSSNDRLDVSDAHYVDAIHSNMGVSGTIRSLGHRDVHLNNGFVQPGCSILDINCSHVRAHEIFVYNQTRDCQIVAYQCPDHTQFQEGNCKSCANSDNSGSSRCTLVNFPVNSGADEYNLSLESNVAVVPSNAELEAGNTNKEVYFVTTGNGKDTPFCQQHYQVHLSSSLAPSQSTLTLVGNDGKEYQVALHKKEGNLWTGLLTFAGPRVKFVESKLKLEKKSNINTQVGVSVEFMSDIDANERRNYSSRREFDS